MRVNKRFTLLAAAAALAVATTAQAAPVYINILTGGTSGVYYPIGVGLSQIYSSGIEGSKTSVQATKASVENLNLLQAGRGELALALGDSVADAKNGVEDAGFKAPLTKLRAIAGAYPTSRSSPAKNRGSRPSRTSRARPFPSGRQNPAPNSTPGRSSRPPA